MVALNYTVIKLIFGTICGKNPDPLYLQLSALCDDAKARVLTPQGARAVDRKSGPFEWQLLV